MTGRKRCSMVDAVRRKECPHYKAGWLATDCRGYETEVTTYRTGTGAVVTIYHCRYDPLPPFQEELL